MAECVEAMRACATPKPKAISAKCRSAVLGQGPWPDLALTLRVCLTGTVVDGVKYSIDIATITLCQSRSE
jgi:hypothetical protein